MTRLFLVALAFAVVMFCVAGCTDDASADSGSIFSIVEENSNKHGHYTVLQHNETGVYYLWCGSGYRGGLTIMLDADGTPYTGGAKE